MQAACSSLKATYREKVNHILACVFVDSLSTSVFIQVLYPGEKRGGREGGGRKGGREANEKKTVVPTTR